MKDINIKSSTIEKGLELAKEFLGKLLGPSFEEVGLLVSENIKYFRFKNQIRILNKAQKYIESRNISTKQIPVKILVPLLENASLEENENLQDKWANMISNMADSESNLQNHVFPYILGQISIEEFTGLEKLHENEKHHFILFQRINNRKKSGELLNLEDNKIKNELENNEEEGFYVSLEEYELANLIRLGLIKKLPPKIYIEEFKTGGSGFGSTENWHKIKAKYEPHSSYHRITELGNQFIQLCSKTK
ncbi:Abi-alpha family protein [uncultured Dokdonia sp.]|uniref:Abi-alpha family protein n=1 Tax=uncultured Dokdonia sp. TaxID=575653 RepID=UPI00261BB4F0|nr:Abi-alpha family protein [uncultured Dokdonia sp.]